VQLVVSGDAIGVEQSSPDTAPAPTTSSINFSLFALKRKAAQCGFFVFLDIEVMSTLQGKDRTYYRGELRIGRSTAIAFAREGARLAVCARRLEPLEELRPTLAAAGAPAVHLFQLDVQKRAEVEAAIAKLPADWKEIDVLVNNAGLSRGLAKLYEDAPENWEEMIDTKRDGSAIC